MPKTVALCMIVKDEARVIRRCLESAIPFVTHWAIVDTGSTDGTQEIARAVIEESGKPGEVIERPFVDFATNRNQALELGRSMGADYLLVLDADEVLRVDGSLCVADNGGAKALTWGEFDRAGYCVSYELGDARWVRAFLVHSADYMWEYRGKIHESLVPLMPETLPIVGGITITNRNDGGSSSDTVGQMNRYATLLRSEMRAASKGDRVYCRALYYLGETLARLGKFDDALACFQERALLDGFDEEVYHSLYQVGLIRQERGDHPDDVIAAYLQAYEARPTRAEPLWNLSVFCLDNGRPALAEMFARQACSLRTPADHLPVYRSVYDYLAIHQLAVCLARLGNVDESLRIQREMLSTFELPDRMRKVIGDNVSKLEAVAA